MATSNLENQWANALTLIGPTLGPATMGQLRRARPLATIEGTILVAVPDPFVQTRIETHAMTALVDALSQLCERAITIQFTVDPQSIPETPDVPEPAVEVGEDAEVEEASPAPVVPAEPVKKVTPLSIDRNTTNLNPKYTFESYVMGPSNRFAHATAFQVAEDPGQGHYNPLFIYGDSGLGKKVRAQAQQPWLCTVEPTRIPL